MEMVKLMFTGDFLLPTLMLMTAAFLAGILVELAVVSLARKSARDDGRARGRAGQPDRRFERRRPAAPGGTIEIYVGNLSYDLTEDVLRKEFEAFGTVESARIITHRGSNKSKGFGFVHMPNRPEAEAAIKALDGKDVLGRRMACNEARNAG